MPEPLVVLLRSPSVRAPDPYGAALEAAGFRFAVVPVLRYEATGRAALRAALARPERYGGLVLTSPRAADALADVGVPEAWRALPCWAVGEETARRARRLGLDARGADAGDAATLAERVVWDQGLGIGDQGVEDRERLSASPSTAHRLPLLFPVGSRRREDLPERLTEAGVPLEELTVYETHLGAPPLLGPDLRPDWLVFFSPSGVEAAAADPAFPWTRARLAAIGPTTADVLRDAGFVPHAVAGDPSPEGLVRALRTASGGEGEREIG